MFVGIDIGGTFTDIVAVKEKNIIYQYKVRTSTNILDCVLKALDCLLAHIEKTTIQRLCISTTIITNTIVKNQLPATSLLVMPGPGFNCENSFPVEPHIIEGYVNHLGNITSSPNINALKHFSSKRNIAISGKFSVRNPKNEQVVESYLRNKDHTVNTVCAHRLSGKLNFLRRTNTAYYAAATQQIFVEFTRQIQQAIDVRGIDTKVVILKADAGTVDIKHSDANTAEFVFTGPAASVLGIKALINPTDECIALDIGGTTTDISFWRNGEAILNNKGAQINGFNTSINTFYLHSLGLGGNSLIKILDKQIQIGPDISTNCICLGGEDLTLTDIFSILGKVDFGNRAYVHEYLSRLGLCETFAQQVFNLAITIVQQKLSEMIAEINRIPVYTVADVLAPQVFNPNRIIGVGGAAAGIIPALAEKMQLKYSIPEFAAVANALGASLAKPTIMASIQANTLEGYYMLSQESVRHNTPRNFNKIIATEILLEHLRSLAKKNNLFIHESAIEVVEYEEYPVLSGYQNSGLVINMTMQIKPDILNNIL